MLRTTLLVCSAFLMLTACSTPSQRAAEMAEEADIMVHMYGPACERLGYAVSTDRWRDCIVQFSILNAHRHSPAYGYPSTYSFPYGFHPR